MRPHPIESHARREMREDTVVRSSTHLQTKTILAVIRRLRLDAHSSDDGALDSKPLVCEIGDGRISAHARSVEYRGAKPQHGNAQRQLPTKGIAAAIDKFRLGSSRHSFGRGCKGAWLSKRGCICKLQLC